MTLLTALSALLFVAPLAGVALLAASGSRGLRSPGIEAELASPLPLPRPARPFELSDLGASPSACAAQVRLPEPFASAPLWEAAGNDYAPAAAQRRPGLGWA
jgi:hypothetical protein